MDQTRRTPGTEYLLQGSVYDDSVDILIHRLKGICDKTEEGLTRFEEHEIVYTTRGGNVSIRVRKQLNGTDKPHTLSYLGNPEIGDKNSLTTIRTHVEASCGQNVCNFLQEMGFIVDFDFIRRGWLFRKNRIKATVSKICSFANKDQITPISKSHLVEVSTISNSSNEQAANDVHQFSEKLKPLVLLEKIDPKRLLIPAQGSVKKYHWGKIGQDSVISRFIKEQTNEPLAELWFGCHPKGPTTILVANNPRDVKSISKDVRVGLDEFFAKHPEMIGDIEKFVKYDKKLPFLFKILSVSQPLSLQAHPDKKLAEILHKKDPDNYPDSNHKPELAIALTEFEVLCDFRPYEEIINFMKTIAPLRALVGEKNYDNFRCSMNDKRVGLGQCFETLMKSDKEQIIRQTQELKAINIEKELLRLVLNLDKLYPGDPGVFAPFFLNYIKLSPGQAVYLKANKLHAYLKGDCIESMVCSDNVVRAGLTTKYRDLETLIKMLDYVAVNNLTDVLFKGTLKCQADKSIISFRPTEEFKVDQICINEKNETYQLESLPGGSFIVVLSGKATTNNFFYPSIEHKLSLGSSAFIPPKVRVKLSNIQGDMTIYRAYC